MWKSAYSSGRYVENDVTLSMFHVALKLSLKAILRLTPLLIRTTLLTYKCYECGLPFTSTQILEKMSISLLKDKNIILIGLT